MSPPLIAVWRPLHCHTTPPGVAMPRDGRPASHLMLWLGLCLLQPSAALRLAPTATLTDGGARFSRWAATHGVEQLNVSFDECFGAGV